MKLGFTRAFGTSLRQSIAQGTSNRIRAFFAGLGITAFLQSSTATALLLTSFAKKHPIPLTAALAVIIGADLSTTLVAQVLTFDLSWLSPLLLVIGIIGHMRYEHGGRKRHIFRVFIGLGLMLLSLSLIRAASAPLVGSDTLPLILAPLESDQVTAIVFAALLTWIIHSSLAAVLLFATLASNGLIDIELGILLVIGANLGGAFIAFIATYKDGPTANRITFGNIVMRMITLLLFWGMQGPLLMLLGNYDFSASRQIVNLHMGFNIVLALLFLPNIDMIAKLAERVFPEIKNAKRAEHEPLYLDEKALDSPVVALASAARETLRMSEMVEDMLGHTLESFKQNNDNLAQSISQKDHTVDKLYNSIKLYLTRLTQEALDPKEADRHLQILTFATNMEHIGDIIDKSLMDMARRKIKHKERFSNEGWEEIKSFHQHVLENVRMAQNIFLSEDPALARQLVEKKAVIRAAAKSSSEHHFKRLREGLPESIATSSMHLDIIRDYRRINTYVTAVAYSILENAEKYKDQRRENPDWDAPPAAGS